jgi:hypothetical protein
MDVIGVERAIDVIIDISISRNAAHYCKIAPYAFLIGHLTSEVLVELSFRTLWLVFSNLHVSLAVVLLLQTVPSMLASRGIGFPTETESDLLVSKIAMRHSKG